MGLGKTWTEGDTTYRQFPGATPRWAEKIEALHAAGALPAFLGFWESGYMVRVIEGDNLLEAEMTPDQRQALRLTLALLLHAGLKTGYLLCPARKSVILSPVGAWVVNFDEVVNVPAGRLWPLTGADYTLRWEALLRTAGVRIRIDGPLRPVLSRLEALLK